MSVMIVNEHNDTDDDGENVPDDLKVDNNQWVILVISLFSHKKVVMIFTATDVVYD